MTRVVRVMSTRLHPWAECVGVDDETPCPIDWELGQGEQTREKAKLHAELYKGHRLRVVIEQVDLYRAQP